jgi:hypothetical protein
MSNFSLKDNLPLILIVVFLLITHIADSIYYAYEIEPSGAFAILSYVFLFSLIGYWLEKDSKRYGVKWMLDMGFFLYLAWPVIIPYHLFKTRGIKAFLTILAFIGIYIGTYLIGLLVYFSIAQN